MIKETSPVLSALMTPPPTEKADSAFVWASGGQRMTPEQIKVAHALSQKQMAAGADYSPVQHWTQGLARVAQGLVGGLGERSARRAEDANADRSDRIVSALMAEQDPGARRTTVLEALTDPYVDDAVRTVAGKMYDQDMEAAKPHYFTAGNSRLRYDPTTGETSELYQAESDAQQYAVALGYEPGTPEFATAMQDYVLRGHGPTAFSYDVDLENTRQDNREDLEGLRQGNRLSLRRTPTYRDLHPAPRVGGGSSPAGPRQPRSINEAVAPIFSKLARGEALSPGEQNALSTYNQRTGRAATPPAQARRPGGAGYTVGQTATGPGGKKVRWNGAAWEAVN